MTIQIRHSVIVLLVLVFGGDLPEAGAQRSGIRSAKRELQDAREEAPVIPEAPPAVPERLRTSFFLTLKFGAGRRTLETPIASRATFFINLANYNAICNYHETAVDVFGRGKFRRFPEEERTLENKNIATIYSILRLIESSPSSFGEPSAVPGIRKFMQDQGLDPDDWNLDRTTDVGIGNGAGVDTARLMAMDGFNAFGNWTTSEENYKQPFADYTGYKPKNSPWKLEYPFRWQPVLEQSGFGFFFRQEHVVPQAGIGLTFSITPKEIDENMERIRAPYPNAHKNIRQLSKDDLSKLRRAAKRTLEESKQLTEKKQILAEYFDGKIGSFEIPEDPGGFVRGIAPAMRFSVVGGYLDHSADEDAFFGLGATMSAYESVVASWKAKVKFDAVRPTAQTMELLFGDEEIEVFGGPGKDTVKIKPRDWVPYLRTMPHSEYPSGSSCLCLTAIEHAKAALLEREDIDEIPDIPYTIRIKKGRSKFYRGEIPSEDFEYTIDKLDDWAEICGESRLWAGVHFGAAVKAGREFCRGMGTNAHNFVNGLVNGAPDLSWVAQIKPEDRFWVDYEN